MMSRECESMRPLISAYMDGELTPTEEAQLQQHLAECSYCRNLLEEYRQLRDQLRYLPPAEPPPHLRQQIWHETVEQEVAQRGRHRPWAIRPRLSFSTAALSIAVLVVLALLLSLGYQRALPPAVAGSSPTDGQLWPIYQPIEITFNKPMDHQSVIENLRIAPAAERERLPVSWRGTTLIIGADQTQRVSLLPDTVYTVAILANAQDQWGHPLGQDWVLRFRTTSVIAGQNTPTPPPAPTKTPPPPSPTPTPAQAQVEPTQLPAPAPTPTSLPSTPPESRQPTQQPVAPTATTPPPPPALSPTPTATPTPAPTSTPEPTSAPELTPTPQSTPAPEATPTPESTVTPVPVTPEPIPVTGAFGQIYWGNESVQQKLGQPLAHAYTVSATEMDFQRGLMIERFDTATIYVLVADGTWFPVPDTWAPDTWPTAQEVEPNLWSPGGYFGAAWRDQALQGTLGYAIEPEAHLMAEGARIQEFEHGILLLSDRGFVYMLLESGTWEQFPATENPANTTSGSEDSNTWLEATETAQP